MEIVGAAADLFLLLRILLLRLHRTYIFITLACTLTIIEDAAALWLGIASPEFGRFFIYSRFLFALAFPAAAWDVFEEIKSLVANLRRAAALRLVSSLILAAIFGFVIVGFADSGNDQSTGQTLVATLGLVLWAASSTASLAFLWSTHRLTRAQKIVLPNNTFVWLVFFQLALLGEVISCFFAIAAPLLNSNIGDVVGLVLGVYSLIITAWCIWKLRAVSSGLSDAPAKANS